jgi:NNP family nitrate/nitrite transporter-like MFS transporter
MLAAVGGENTSLAWRIAFIFPGAALIICALFMYKFSDDSPRGNYVKLINAGLMTRKRATASAREGFGDPCTWLLAIQYGCCFGVELTVNNTMSTYFQERFDLDLVTAGAVASSFGLMNLFARAIGGLLSDTLNNKIGFSGRLWAQMICLLVEGSMLVVFSRMDVLEAAVPMLVLFSIGVQMSEGSSFGIVPYIRPNATGSVAGVVGDGGNKGAVCWGFIFKWGNMTDSDTLMVIGFIVLASALMTPFLFVKDQPGMFCNPRFSPVAGTAKDDAKKQEPQQNV